MNDKKSNKVYISPQSIVEDEVKLGENVVIWEGSKIRTRAALGTNTKLGRNVYVGQGVSIGRDCKIQDHCLIYEPAQIGNGVFVGPGCVFTNDKHPRALSASGGLANQNDWQRVGVIIEDGASIGAMTVLIAPVRIGAGAMVGAGSVVTRDVAPGATVAGNPARLMRHLSDPGT